MNLSRAPVALSLAMLILIGLGLPAAAKDVSANIYAKSFAFHLGSPTAAADPTVTVVAGDVIRFRVENQDAGTTHTFNVTHFGVAESLSSGAIIFVNITTAAADVGTWQFWCFPHSSGATPETHTGMIGSIQVNAAPRQPGFETVAAILAAGIAFGVLAVYRVRRQK